MATHDRNNSLFLNLPASRLKNAVVREVRDRESQILGRIIQPHDGTEAGVIAAAQAATDRMYREFFSASNGESRICATDACGNPRWVVSPNFQSLAEIGTGEALYIWGGRADFQAENSYPLCSQKCTGSQEWNTMV